MNDAREKAAPEDEALLRYLLQVLIVEGADT